MDTLILTVSSKGQIALPVSIRKALDIQAGTKLFVNIQGDIVMLKKIELPSDEEFEAMLDEAQQWAASVGYTEEDVNRIIKEVRKSKK